MTGTRPNIWQLQSRRDIEGLIAALAYADPEVRRRAAGALRSLDVTEAVPALKAALRRETDTQTRRSLATALHDLDHRTDVKSLIKTNDVDGLIQALHSRHPEHVIAAARALGRLNDRLAVEPLVILFHNVAAPPAVRLAAAEALLELKSAPAVVTLLGALRRDAWQVRRNAAAVLGQIQATWAVEPLADALTDPHPVVRRTAAAALRRIGTADAIATLRARAAPQAPVRQKSAPRPPKRASSRRASRSRPPQTDRPRAPTEQDTTRVVSSPEPSPAEPTKPRPPAEPEPAKEESREVMPSLPSRAPTRPATQQEADETQSHSPEQRSHPVRRLIAFLRQRGSNSL